MHAGDQLDQGGLAAAVLADEAMHLAGQHVPIDPVERQHAAEALADGGEPQEWRESAPSAGARRVGRPLAMRQRPMPTSSSMVSLLIACSFWAWMLRVGGIDLHRPEARDLHAVGGRLALGQHVADIDDHLAGQHRVPDEAFADGTRLDVLRPLARRERPDHGDARLLAALLDGARGADRPLAAEGQDALQVRVGAHLVQCGLVAVVHALGDAEAVGDQLHVRVLLLLQRDRGVGPLVVQRHGERADIDDVLALAAHRLGERFHVGLAEALDAGQLDVPVVVLLVRALVGQHLDAGFLGALEHRLERHRVVRHHGDHVDLAGDQVLDRAHLLRRVGLGRADHRGVDAELLALLLDARPPWR